MGAKFKTAVTTAGTINLSRSPLQHPLAAALYLVMLLMLGKLLFPLDEQLGMVAFFALMIPFFFFLLRWPNTPGALYGGICIMLLGKLVYAITTNPVTGPDEIHYYEQVSTFDQLSDFMPYAWNHIMTQWANVSAYPMFGLLYMPFFKWLAFQDPLPIIMLNSVLLILIVNQTYRLNESRFNYQMEREQVTRFHSIVILGLLVSPSFMLMSSVFAKDVTCALLGIYCAGLLLRRKYLLFILLLLYSTGLRDYSLVYTFGYFFLYANKIRTAVVVMCLAMGILVMQIGPLGLINSSLLTFYLFISPNPIKFSNWDITYLFRTLEALFMSIGLIISILNFIRFKETRPFYAMVFTLLFTYACTLVLVGYVTVTGRDLDYGVGTIGDNMVRKKLPVLPLLYIVQAYTFVWARKWFQFSGKTSLKRKGAPYARP
ncbi:hypothetical protein Back11_09100 [Paenibacillus baekrokdamisoli]|uniref:Uncharacterized protein n=1 Tax=Paenibacillus baekrokdamisoli TaxID=1712516 RepID=A0A3G9IU50_9BACL|nr:hypothetical protein [Paenibacillus baekrokdamisoli]MBB3067246.1 hypothetical protein [Paenibacillus baekrokdamisoli]BBH19565.1 hypothetical protein Back11_09100 [Paenibacillus baekrokdamisoli]